MRTWREKWALPAVLALAAVHFSLQLGASSYFVDEALSVEHALPGLGGIARVVSDTETTPWTYFFGLHLWLGHGGSQAEWSTRLPSVIAGVLLVAATFWTARAFVGRRVALGAALLCALSPFVLEYAQQARVYVFAMLATTVAVGATARRGRWLWLGGAAAVLALLCHYTAAFAIGPLAVWLVRRGDVGGRARAGFLAAILGTGLVLAPLLVHQYRMAPNGGDLADAGLSASAFARVVSVAFDGRWVAGVDWLRVVALVAVVGSAVVVAARPAARERGLLLAVAFTAPAGLLLADLAGKEVMISRYAAAGVPMALIVVAAALGHLAGSGRAQPAVLGSAVAVALAGGLVRSHDPRSGFYAPTREAIDYIAAHARPGDVVVVPGAVGTDIPLAFYAERRLHPNLPFVQPGDAARAFDGTARVWIIRQTDEAALPARLLLRFADGGVRPYGYRATAARAFDTSLTLSVILTAPVSDPPPR